MKKWIFLLLFCVHSLLTAAPLTHRHINPRALNELLSVLGISSDSDIVAETQKQWLRKPGQERWEMKELSDEQKESVLKWGIEQNMFSAWKPSLKQYDKAFIFGAATFRMQARLNYLKELWDEGIRFNEIVWLTGDRPLDERVDSLLDRCQTESEAARILWEETDLPQEMRSLPVEFITAPMKNCNGVLQRPNTQDTLFAYVKQFPMPCKGLFVSCQPYCGYQFSIVNAILPDAFLFDVVGQEADPYAHPAAAAVFLDTLARWLYQERLNANVVFPTMVLNLPQPVEIYMRRPQADTFPLLVFLHGANTERGIQSLSKEFLDHWLLKGYAVAAISSPGFGKSAGQKDFCGPKTLQTLHSALDHIKESLGVKDFGIIGHGQGGIAALLLAAKRRDIRCIVSSNAAYDLLPSLQDEGLKDILRKKNYEIAVEPQEFKKRSPLEYVDAIQAKVYILHLGVLPVSDPQAFATAMHNKGIECTVDVVSCWFCNPNVITHEKVLEHTEKWVDTQMKE